ncbi:MAG: UxaA family hydrolase [Peptococcaceae bacterium]
MEKISLAVMNERDNVATAVRDIKSGEKVKTELGTEIKILQDIPFGHKAALTDIAPGKEVIKYGEPIGIAVKSIHAGEHAHVHNVDGARGRGDLEGGIAK